MAIYDNFTWHANDCVEFTYYTGHPSQVVEGIGRSVSAYSRHGAFHQKIGMSNDPVVRWRNGYQRYGWSEMRVIYMSYKRKYVQDMERKMVERFQSDLVASAGYYWNVAPGGEGPPANSGPYYLYVVNAPKFARIRPW